MHPTHLGDSLLLLTHSNQLNSGPAPPPLTAPAAAPESAEAAGCLAAAAGTSVSGLMKFQVLVAEHMYLVSQVKPAASNSPPMSQEMKFLQHSIAHEGTAQHIRAHSCEYTV